MSVDAFDVGQIVVTDLPATKTVTQQNSDGSWNFVIPRFFNGGTIVGGTKEILDWRLEPSIDTRRRLLEGGKKLFAEACGISKPEGEDVARHLKVVADVVGRRPARQGGMRLEVEAKEPKPGQKNSVIHAYGAGGRGYEMSWGIASEVAELAKSVLYENSAPKSKL